MGAGDPHRDESEMDREDAGLAPDEYEQPIAETGLEGGTMTENDRPKLATWLTGCADVYDREVSHAAMSIWWNILKAFDVEAVERAFKAHVADPDTGRFMPTPACIVGRVMGGSEAIAVDAWSKVLRGIKQAGGYRTVAFDDCLIHAVIESLGGWVRLCETRSDELPFRRKDFIATYIGFRRRGERPRYPGLLYGRHDSRDVVLIGDQTSAQRVIEGGGVFDQSRKFHVLAIADALDRIKLLPEGTGNP